MNEFDAKKLAKKELVDFMKVTEKNKETFNHVSSLFHTIIGGVNDIAHTYMLDAIDKGVLPYEQKYINARYFVTLSFRNRKERIAVDWVTFDKAIIGKELTIK